LLILRQITEKPMMRNKKLQVWLPLIFSIVMIAGMYFGYKLGNQGGSKKGFFRNRETTTLQEVLDLIRLRYVDSVGIDSLEGRAIQEMMAELDPHSVYFPPVELDAANEDLAGNFEGIGVEFHLYNDTVHVVHVIPEGPSDAAGLRIGDQIIGVENNVLAGKGYDVEEIKKQIRGKLGSKANLSIRRQGKMIKITVTRGRIPVNSIDAAYLMDKGVGYIKLSKFTERSYEEFMAALESLKKQGMKSLIYDLRGNRGGFMNEAVEMADEFLSGDKLVVYTQGVNSRKREFKCKRPGLFEEGRLVILVDELSASASEVLAGALQDWCRATILGRRTFGKGLVQEQFELSDGSAIRLTVARYYTPLGRSIQRSYDNGEKIYMDEIYDRFVSGEVYSADSAKKQRGKLYLTSCNDSVYAGDGITPDVFVPIDTSQAVRSINRVLEASRFNYFVYNYYLGHATEINTYKSAADFVRRFDARDMWNAFSTFVARDSLNLSSLTSFERELLQQRLNALLARYRWRNSGYFEVLNHYDGTVGKAVSLIRES
jgi:carboxyl-terminal processing protease